MINYLQKKQVQCYTLICVLQNKYFQAATDLLFPSHLLHWYTHKITFNLANVNKKLLCNHPNKNSNQQFE